MHETLDDCLLAGMTEFGSRVHVAEDHTSDRTQICIDLSRFLISKCLLRPLKICLWQLLCVEPMDKDLDWWIISCCNNALNL